MFLSLICYGLMIFLHSSVTNIDKNPCITILIILTPFVLDSLTLKAASDQEESIFQSSIFNSIKAFLLVRLH